MRDSLHSDWLIGRVLIHASYNSHAAASVANDCSAIVIDDKLR